jgi:hypothetical protein
MFGLAAARREKIGDSTLNKFASQSIPMIAIGRCQQSNGVQFYNPESSTFVSSIDYKFQYNVTSGARFNYRYQPGTFIYRLDETNHILTPKFALNSEVLVHTHSPPHRATIVGLPSYDQPDVYTVLFPDGLISEYTDDNNILTLAPVQHKSGISALLPPWIQDGANATVFLSNMSRPHHGKLRINQSDQWIFTPGDTIDLSQGILLNDLSANFQHLLDTGQLFKGHTKFRHVYNARTQVQLKDSILRHVSAHGLTSLVAPTSLKSHDNMSTNDK